MHIYGSWKEEDNFLSLCHYSAEDWVQLTNCCDGGSLVEDVSGAHILDGLGINSLSQEGKEQLCLHRHVNTEQF